MLNQDANVNNLIKSLECLKCGTRENLLPYKLSYSQYISSRRVSRRTTELTYKVHSIPVPVCFHCQKQFRKWAWGKTLFILLGIAGFFPFWPSLIFFFISLGPMGSEPSFLQVLGIIIGIVIMTVAITLYYRHKKKDSNPSNYMLMGPDLIPYIKPKNQGWVKYEDWVRFFSTGQILPTKVSQPRDTIYVEMINPDTTDKFDMIIFQYLRQNVRKAFTEKALISRIMKKVPNESDKEYLINNIESILNRLALQKRINKVQRNGQFYYSST